MIITEIREKEASASFSFVQKTGSVSFSFILILWRKEMRKIEDQHYKTKRSCPVWIYRPAHKDNTENTNKKIEKFTKKDEEISYQYLSKLALKTKDSFLSTYQLIQGRNGSDSESKAEMDGITMDLKLYSKKEQSVGKLLESEYNNQTKNLSEQSNIQNVKVYDVVKGSGCYIQQIDYEIKNDTTVYPCALYLKIDDVSEDAILDTVITVDNTKSDDKTAAILKEVLSANGIEIK